MQQQWENIIMTEKTFSGLLHQQARNAIDWLSQKVPGTQDYTQSDLARGILSVSGQLVPSVEIADDSP